MAAYPVRPIRVENNVAYITLTKGYEAVIDAADVPLVGGFNWLALLGSRTVYVMRHKKTQAGPNVKFYLHRVLLDAPPGMVVDHINGDGLDNRRANLRLATVAENSRNARRALSNTTGLKGVTHHLRDGRWQAQISVDGQIKYLGSFEHPDLAHAVYCAAARFYFGEFARAE